MQRSCDSLFPLFKEDTETALSW